MSCSFSSSDSTCGPTAYAPEDASIIPVRACRKDLSGYLTSLGVSGCRGIGTSNILAEYELILNRAGFYNLSREDTEKMTICPKHRYELSTHFQQLPPRCLYPIHRGEKKSLKNPRRVNKKVSEEMFSLYHVKVPIGSVICSNCRKQHGRMSQELTTCDSKDELEEQGDESNDTGSKISPVEEAEETNLNAAFAFLEVSSDPTSRREEVEITLDRTVCSIEDEDQEVSFWIDEEQSHQESRIDVAYGTKELKLDSGEKITIPNVIRTMVSSRLIKQYISLCQEIGFEPASERTLYRIIDVCSASKQKSMQGLDYFSTEGAQAFETLQIDVNTLEKGGADSTWAREMSKTLQETKRYLKTD
ncbi:unnamed protein product [Porites lobata]|uniref:Uncharacterized protein n=1 Tax=Porites lobata TaxID=104759 RepID=A0ABN8P2C2_9CNID|nr:unnamed protein product [Porites lobata]